MLATVSRLRRLFRKLFLKIKGMNRSIYSIVDATGRAGDAPTMSQSSLLDQW